jgi:hypothetical protein
MLTEAHVHADAERRLGRALTYAEKQLDIVGIDRDLATGKLRLQRAIEAQKKRAIRGQMKGIIVRVDVSVPMLTALLWLYDRGAEHARAEMRRFGVEPRRAYAERRHLPLRIVYLVSRMRGLLGGLQVKVQNGTDSAITQVALGEVSRTAVTRALEQELTGSLDVASRLVSSAFTAGLADTYSGNQDLFAGWQITGAGDNHQCDACSDLDGAEFETLDEVSEVMDNDGFGPVLDCFGDGRCRCRTVPTGAAESVAV